MKGKCVGHVKKDGANTVLVTVDVAGLPVAVRIEGIVHPDLGDGVSVSEHRLAWAYGEAKVIRGISERYGHDDLSANEVANLLALFKA